MSFLGSVLPLGLYLETGGNRDMGFHGPQHVPLAPEVVCTRLSWCLTSPAGNLPVNMVRTVAGCRLAQSPGKVGWGTRVWERPGEELKLETGSLGWREAQGRQVVRGQHFCSWVSGCNTEKCHHTCQNSCVGLYCLHDSHSLHDPSEALSPIHLLSVPS